MFRRLTLLGLMIIACTGQAALAGGFHRADGYDIADAESVDEAVADISAILEKQGFEIVAVIDHAAAAASVDLTLRPTQVILFRQPRLDIRLIRRSQTSGIDLPMKMLVFEDDTGAIRHKYNAPGYLVDRHDLPVSDWLVWRVDRVLRQFGDLDNGLVSIPAEGSVPDIVARLTEILAGAGFRIPITIDFTEDAHRRLAETTLIIFGNPRIGTQLMSNAQEVALDLPQKFLVWEDRKGQSWISYNDPHFIAKRADVQGLDGLLDNIAAALAGFAAEGAGE